VRVKVFLSSLLVCGVLVNACASAADDLQKRLSTLKSMQANFKQTVTQDGHKRYSRGQFLLQRPGKFRWQVTSPTEELIVSDGKTMWLYDKDLEQVTVRKLDGQLKQTPALFLSGYDKAIAERYQISKTDKKGVETYQLLAKNRTHDNQSLRLTFKGNALIALRLTDELGQQLDLRFTQLKTNSTIAAKNFAFIIPKGVDVVTEKQR